MGETASGKKICVQTHRQRPEAPGARDALDAPCQRTYRSQRETHRQCEFGRSSPRHRASGRRSPRHLLTTERGRAFSFWTHRVRAFSFWTHRVRAFSFWTHRFRAFSFWTQPCQGISLLDVSGRRMSWHHGHAGCQGAEHRSKYYSHRIRKPAVGSRHSDSIQFYSLYLMYIYICYYHTSRSQQKHPASRPSPRSSSNAVLMCVPLLCVLETKESWQIRHDAMSTTR